MRGEENLFIHQSEAILFTICPENDGSLGLLQGILRVSLYNYFVQARAITLDKAFIKWQ